MKDETYKRTLETAKTEMAELLHQRDQVNQKIAKLAPVIEYLSLLCDEPPPSDISVPAYVRGLGLSDAIRFVLKTASAVWLSPTQVRDRLREAGFDLKRYQNELPPIHNTLIRLRNAEEIEEISRPSGEKAYRWVSKLKRELLELDPIPTREEVLRKNVPKPPKWETDSFGGKGEKD